MRNIKDIKDNEVIHCSTKQEAIEILALVCEIGLDSDFNNRWVGYWDFYKKDTCYNIKKSQYCKYDYYKALGFNIISVSEFIFKLPEKWCIQITKENREIVKDYFQNKLYTDRDVSLGYFYHYPALRPPRGHALNTKNPNYIEITFEQFKKYVLKQDKNMEKKIIGYNIKKEYMGKEGYIAKALDTHCGTIDKYWMPSVGGVYENAVNLGVLNTWFEPVFAESTKTLVLGSSKVAIKLGKNFAEVDGDKFSMYHLRLLLHPHSERIDRSQATYYNVTLLDARYKIGCSDFTLEEIKLIINTYDSLQ